MHDDVPEADRQEQLEPGLDAAPTGGPSTPRDLEVAEPDLLEQARPIAATTDDHPPGSDDDRLVDLSEEWERR
jgi:hypothetical protein